MLAACVVALVIAGLLVPVPFISRVAVAVGDLMHAPLFGCLTLGGMHLLEYLRPLRSVGKSLMIRSIWVAMCLVTFGILIEWMQSYSGRSLAVHDAIANGLGVLAALFWYWSRSMTRLAVDRRWLPRVLLIAVGIVLSIAWWRPAAMLLDVAAKHFQFPMLASFETKTEYQRFYFGQCRPRRTRENATDGNYAMELVYQPAQHPAATMIEMVHDWSAMAALEMDVTLDASHDRPSARFMVKVTDDRHDGKHNDTFRQQWEFGPGQSRHIRITREELLSGPDTRQLDLSQIRFVDLMLLDVEVPTTLRIDAIRLAL